jgi:hypothetical protein
VRIHVVGRRLLVAVACAAAVMASTSRETAQASHCIITPALAKVAIVQGLPYARLTRGKETLVKPYLTLPSTLPKCAGTTPTIKVMGASLTLNNGATQLGPTIAALPDAAGALVTSKSVAQNQPADPKFVVPGSRLPPATSGIAGSFTASFAITVQYQSAARGETTFTSTQSVTYTSAAGSPISRVVEGPTKALRLLAVPGGRAFDATMTSTLSAGLTALSAMYPVQDLTGSTPVVPRVGVLPTTQGGIRYALNNPGIVNLGTTPFCGTSSNYAGIQTQLQGFHNAWNNANTTENDVDRTVGVFPSDVSLGSPGCYEGFTITNTQQAWVRVIPDAPPPGAPSMTGSLLAMEICHTFDCTTSTATRHSLYTNADNLAENTNLAFNPLTWAWLSDDRTAMRFTAPGWNNQTTVLEKGDFGYLLCGLGGLNTSGCPPTGAGTLTGVAAGPTFLLDGTTDGTQRRTTVLNSFSSTLQPETTPDAVSAYRLRQKNAAGAVLSDLGVPVRFVHSGHVVGDQDVGPSPIGAFSFAFPFAGGATRMEFVKLAASGTTLLYAANQTATPSINDVEVSDSGGGPIILSEAASTRQQSASPTDTAEGLAPAQSSETPGTSRSGESPSADSSIAAAGQGTGLSTTYVFSGKGGYSADGLGQKEPGGTLQADVPAGSTVKKAFLYGTYFGGTDPLEAQRTIEFDGTTVVTTKIGDDGSFLATARADVTGQVAAKVGDGGGITDFAIGSDPGGLDGVGLVVVYSNPTLPTRTVAVLDGSADQGADTTTFTYASPLDKAIEGFSATMSLGVGFGFQGGSSETAGTSTCGTESTQSSLVDVNGARLTSCAGNHDDGFGVNGALITVGGVGDTTANPADPFQQPADGLVPRVEDDELYDIAPFTKQGDTELTITSSNPSQDDNLFLAVVQFAAQTTVENEICDNGVDDDGDKLVDAADSDCAFGTVQTEATDSDNPSDLRATCYVDWGGVKHPLEVADPPIAVNEETGKAKFLCSFDPDVIGATDAGTANITVVVNDTFTQSAPATAPFDSEQTPPVASIAAPSPDGTTALQFETIALSGSALDAEEGHLTGEDLAWTAPGLIAVEEHGEHVFLEPPEGTGWTPGSYTITLTATDAANKTSTDTVTIEILRDGDHDGIPAGEDFAACPPVPGSGDNDASNATADPDSDGIPNVDDQYTTGGPCVAEATYNAIIDFDPDDLQRNTSGTPITVKVRVPYRNVSEIVGSSVKISKIVYADANGDIAEATPNQPAIEWSAKGQDGTAKFDRQKFIATLNSLKIANQRIVVEVSGNFSGSPTTSWVGRDATNVK